MKGFDTSLGEEGVRAALSETFSQYGKVNQVRLPTDRDTGELKGIGFIEFENQEAKVHFSVIYVCSIPSPVCRTKSCSQVAGFICTLAQC